MRCCRRWRIIPTMRARGRGWPSSGFRSAISIGPARRPNAPRPLPPEQARTKTVLGYAALARVDIQPPQPRSSAPSRSSPTTRSPGSASASRKYEKGTSSEGRREIEIAAALSPEDPIVRSYLGKAYFDERRETDPARSTRPPRRSTPSTRPRGSTTRSANRRSTVPSRLCRTSRRPSTSTTTARSTARSSCSIRISRRAAPASAACTGTWASNSSRRWKDGSRSTPIRATTRVTAFWPTRMRRCRGTRSPGSASCFRRSCWRRSASRPFRRTWRRRTCSSSSVRDPMNRASTSSTRCSTATASPRSSAAWPETGACSATKPRSRDLEQGVLQRRPVPLRHGRLPREQRPGPRHLQRVRAGATVVAHVGAGRGALRRLGGGRSDPAVRSRELLSRPAGAPGVHRHAFRSPARVHAAVSGDRFRVLRQRGRPDHKSRCPRFSAPSPEACPSRQTPTAGPRKCAICCGQAGGASRPGLDSFRVTGTRR